ncbi:hypothetical protein BB561_004592 [Smittium simulii]|uniref:Uncharacterized protein n=1 Tax=Smittium simulii TaxID=133385 RepID=A0A2T9YFA7_9FUNG|nr:hypothetical protein BB561_004592 [Smittium simulii]
MFTSKFRLARPLPKFMHVQPTDSLLVPKNLAAINTCFRGYAKLKQVPPNKAYLNFAKPPNLDYRAKKLFDSKSGSWPETIDDYLKGEYYKKRRPNNTKFYVYSASTAVVGYLAFESFKHHDDIVPDIQNDKSIIIKTKKYVDYFDAHLPENRGPTKYTIPAKKINAQTPSSVEHQVEWTWSHPGLYVWGSNEHGTLDPENVKNEMFFYPKKVDCFGGILIKSASFAQRHAALIDDTGNVYQWGEYVAGKKASHKPKISFSREDAKAVVTSKKKAFVLCGKSDVYKLDPKNLKSSPEKLQFDPPLAEDEEITMISAGLSHISAVTSKGSAYVAPVEHDGNISGQLGKTSQKTISEPGSASIWSFSRIPDIEYAVKSACGDKHTLISTANGEVYAFGSNEFGQLGIGMYGTNTDLIDRPVLVPNEFFKNSPQKNSPDIIDIAVGGNTSYFITHTYSKSPALLSQIEVYAAGYGSSGQLGNKTFNMKQSCPTKIQTISDKIEYDTDTKETRSIGVYDISAGNKHAVVIQDNKVNSDLNQIWDKSKNSPIYGRDVVAWGDNNFGQCLPCDQKRIPEPLHPIPIGEEIDAPQKVKTKVYNEQFSNSNMHNCNLSAALMPLMPVQSRLQAAPSKYVHTFDFVGENKDDQNSFDIQRNKILTLLELPENCFFEDGNKSSENKTVKVEQKFVAGFNSTAAYLTSL